MFREEAITNLIFFPAIIAIGLLMSFLLFGAMRKPTGYATAAITFYAIGFALFVASKIQNIRKGHLLSFGSGKMSTPWKWTYRVGYVLMGLGLVLTMVLGIVAKFNT
jgi:hypothetical protein